MKLIKKLLVFILIFAAISGYAQKQANYWYFGDYAGLNFGMGIPVPLTDGALSTGEGCSSISTSGGNLQFYTDGRFVYDRNNDQMPNGSGLLGHSSSTQSGIIVPKPGSTTMYYIFTVDAYDNGLAAGLCYSRVDMTLNGGLGDVVTSEKNISLLPYSCEKVTAVGHDDGYSIWVITHQWGSDAFYAYLVTSAGVNTEPVISHTGEPLVGDQQASKGYLKVSPDGTKIAMANNTAYTVGIFNFSNLSGTVTHIITDHGFVNPGGNDPGGPYGVEFSPNSHVLYIGEWKANRRISQYDVSTNDGQAILDSKTIVAQVGQSENPIGALQLGPDNRMYIARRDNPSLSRINSPNTLGIDCSFENNAVNLAGKISMYGLPPFIQSFFYLSADYYWENPTCDGTPVQFYTSASDTPDSVLWNFGDPASGPDNTSTLLNPTHLYSGIGQYWVTINVYLYGVVKNAFHILVISTPPEVTLPNDTTVCAYDTYTIDAGPGFDAYLWQNGETTQSILCETSGLYWCKVTGDGGCYDIDSINVVINPVPEVNAGDDQTIANGASITLDGSLSGGSGNFAYHWEPANLLVNPNVLQPTTVSMTGTTLFTLTVTDNQGGCIDDDQVLITVLGGALACNPIADPPAICFGGQSQLNPLASGGSGNYTYTWTSTPAGFNSTLPDPVVNPIQNTTYHVEIYDGYSTITGNVTLVVNQLPVPNAGPDKTIPFGTSTTLQGSASFGSGTYYYLWEPQDKVVNPYVATPTTVLLNATTLFTLTVRDAQTNCVCDESDNMTVVVTGNALDVNPIGEPDTICSGDSVQLYALASGGSGLYTYEWNSNPPGFTSALPNPTVAPMANTSYSVYLSDGYTQISGTISIMVHQTPVIDIGPSGTVCVFDTLTLDAGNEGSTYIWSNGSTEQSIMVGTTGIGFDVKQVTVTVTSPEGCSATAQRTIVFDFAACTGIDEPGVESNFAIYPNPGNGTIRIENKSGSGKYELSVTDIYGREIIKNREIIFSASENTCSLDLKSSPQGIYLVRISENGRTLAAMKYLLR
jgi:hypothetical protein